MGGVDKCDQYAALYNLNKNAKWWEKVFYKLFFVSVVNSWIIFKDVKRNPNLCLLDFMMPLAEQLIRNRRQTTHLKKKISGNSGNRAKKARLFQNVGDHLPTQGSTRRRCRRCADRDKESKTKTMCLVCNVPICLTCLTPFHMQNVKINICLWHDSQFFLSFWWGCYSTNGTYMSHPKILMGHMLSHVHKGSKGWGKILKRIVYLIYTPLMLFHNFPAFYSNYAKSVVKGLNHCKYFP